MKKRFSIKRYLKASVLIWVLLVSLVTTVWMYFDAKHEIDELFDASLVQSARILDDLLFLHPLGNEPHESASIPSKTIQQVALEVKQDGHEYEKNVAFQVWSTDNKLLYKSDSAPTKRFTVSETGFHRAVIHDHQWRAFSLYSKQNKWWLLVAESDEIRDELAGHIVKDHILPLIIGIPLLLLALHLLINKGLTPLRKVATELNEKHHQDLSQINNDETPEEVLSLVDSLNGLFLKLDKSYERERRFSADAAHELRNPLAALMINTDNALEDVIDLQKSDLMVNDTNIREHLKQQVSDLSNIKNGIQQLSHSVQQLLALSRAENQITDENISQFSVLKLTNNVAGQYKIKLDSKKQPLHTNISKDHMIYGYKALFSMLLGNLLSNTTKYAGQNAEVYLSTKMLKNGTLELIYEDTGNGIAIEEITRVKNRFYRANNSSSESGSGLGLSIVDAIVNKHQGTWELSQSDKGGLKINILLKNIEDLSLS